MGYSLEVIPAPRAGRERSDCRVESALDDVHGQAASGCFLVFAFHVCAGLAHGADHFVERDKMLTVAAQRHAHRVDGLHRTHRVALDAWHLDQPADRVAGQAKVVLHADFGGVFHLLHVATQNLTQRAGGHGASDADFALAADFGARDRRIFLVQNTDGGSREEEPNDAVLIGSGNKAHVVMQHGRNDPGGAVGGRGYHAAAVGVFFVDGQCVQVDPVEYRQRITQRRFRVFAQLAMQGCRPTLDLKAARQNPLVAAASFNAILHDLPDAQQALTGLCFGTPRGFVGQHHLADGKTARRAMRHQVSGGLERVKQLRLVFDDAVGACSILIHDKAAADRVVLAAAHLQTRGIEGTEDHAVRMVGQRLANHRQVMFFDELDAVFAQQIQAFIAADVLQACRYGANQVAVAEHVVDATDRRPVFAFDQRGDRVYGLLAAVRMAPFAHQFSGGVRCVFQRVVVLVQSTAFHRADFFANLDHRVTEAIQFLFGFALGRLDHQRAGNREGHGRRVEAEVDQAFGDVIYANATGFLQRAQVEDAFVRDQAVAAGVKHRVVLFQATGDVVGVENRQLRSALETFAAHHADVHPGDRQDARAAERGCTDCTLLALHTCVTRHERRQVGFHANRANARAATTVGDAKGFVQIEVGHVAAELTRSAQADHGIHVGAVDIHLAAVVVNDAADFADTFFEHTVGGWVGDHQCREGDRVVTGGGAEHGLQFVGQLLITRTLLGRGKRMQIAEFGPGDWDHFAGGVELHGARPQRDHRAVQCQVLVRQATQVAHQLGFGVIAVEYRVAENHRLAFQLGRQACFDAVCQRGEVRQSLAFSSEQGPQHFDVGLLCGFVQRDTQALAVYFTQVDFLSAGLGVQVSRPGAGVQGDAVEEERLLGVYAQLAQAFGQDCGQMMHAIGDAGQAARAVVHGVHAGDVGEQNLRGADIAGGLLATDVLLAGLHGQTQGGLAEAVDGHTDQSARHVTLVGVAGGEVRGVRAAETQRHTEALRAANRYVCTELAGRGEQGQGQQVGCYGHQGIGGMEALDQLAIIEHVAITGRVLQQRAEELADVGQLQFVCDDHLNAQRLGAGLQHVEGLRVAVSGGKELIAAFVLAQAFAEGHRFSGGSGFVKQRGIGDRQAGEVADQRLEIQQRLKSALGDLWLIRRVSGVPRRIFQQVAQDRCRRVGVVVTLANVGFEQLVLGGNGFDIGQCIGLALAGGQA
nr:hypothetical protein [Tanacetum cinerariifolium]